MLRSQRNPNTSGVRGIQAVRNCGVDSRQCMHTPGARICTESGQNFGWDWLGQMSDAYNQIANLLYRYAEAFDTARFDVLDELFADVAIRNAIGSGEPGPVTPGPQFVATARDSIITYADGTPRTRHIVTNPIIEIDEAAGRATSRSYVTTLQQVPPHPIEIMATAKYEDTFERVDGTWRFAERTYRRSSIDGQHRDFIGDMSRHTRTATPGEKR